MNKDKVYLKGYVIGRAADTLGYEGLMVQLENLDIVEIDKNLVYKEIDESQPIKLKDVITRIKDFDSGTQKVWLNEILNELGSDYGTLKYKAGYEQGKVEGALIHCEEPQKITVPQFVADWYEKHKDDFEFALFRCIDHIPSVYDEGDLNKFEEWIIDGETKPFQTLVNMHQFGYTVEKEPKYTVKIKGKIGENLLVYGWGIKRYFFARTYNDSSKRGEHTRKELEEDGFGWVFDCPGVEVEEVTE